MAYQAVLVYTTDGEPLGYSIKKSDAFKLQSTNIWTEDEIPKLNEQLGRLNESVELSSVWPDANDPEVKAVLANPSFMPIEMHLEDVVDDDNSWFVYTQEPEYDINGDPTGENVDGELDQEASVIKTKKMMVPVRPSEVMERTKAACEQVARARAGL